MLKISFRTWTELFLLSFYASVWLVLLRMYFSVLHRRISFLWFTLLLYFCDLLFMQDNQFYRQSIYEWFQLMKNNKHECLVAGFFVLLLKLWTLIFMGYNSALLYSYLKKRSLYDQVGVLDLSKGQLNGTQTVAFVNLEPGNFPHRGLAEHMRVFLKHLR